MSLAGKQKIYFLLNRLDENKVLAPSGTPVLIHPMRDLKGNYPTEELFRLLIKLQNDDKIIKIAQLPTPSDARWTANWVDDCFGITLLPAFDDYFVKMQSEPEYQEFSGKKPPVVQAQIRAELKPHRKALEKMWNVLQEIEERRNITSTEDDIAIPQVHLSKVKNEREADAAADERFNILRKLENEEKAIKDVRWPHDHNKLVYLKLGDSYSDTFSKYEEEYKNVAKYHQQNQEEEKVNAEDTVYEIKYSDRTREILVNGFLLAKPDFDSENEVVFSFLYNHPNKTYKLAEIGTELKRLINKTSHKIIENLGFTGDLKKVFFDVSKDSICFKNPITKQDLDKIGISHIKLQK